MTYTASHNDIFTRILTGIRQMSSWTARAVFGVFVFVAAAFALLATTFIGLMIAAAALCLKAAHSFGRGGSARRPKPDFRSKEPGARDGQTLDAHRTADGWVIDTTFTPKS